MRNSGVSIWCDEIFALYSSKPVVDKYKGDGIAVHIYTKEKYKKHASSYLGLEPSNVISIEDIDSRLLYVLHRLIVVLCVASSFSPMYNHIMRRQTRRILVQCNKFSPFKIDRENINKFYFIFFNLFAGHRIRTKKLISFSLVEKPYLIASKKISHIKIMESWDHPVKVPHLCQPNIFLTWNNALKEDSKKYQCYKRTSFIRPLKFSYIYNLGGESDSDIFAEIKKDSYRRELIKLEGKDMILYPVSISSRNKEEHLGELAFIENLINYVENSSRTLYIKPKPNGVLGDYDCFAGRKNVIIGMYSNDSSSLDMLDDDYHRFRYLLLKKSVLVVNTYTTFALEAALMDKPILQLNLKGENFGIYPRYAINPHISKYFLTEFAMDYYGEDKEIDCLIEHENTVRFSRYLKNWVLNR